MYTEDLLILKELTIATKIVKFWHWDLECRVINFCFGQLFKLQPQNPIVFLILLPAFPPLLYSFLSWLGQWSLASYRGEREEINLVSFVWNYGMAQLECCGLENYLDFTNSSEWKRSKLNLQASDYFWYFMLFRNRHLTFYFAAGALCLLYSWPNQISMDNITRR